MARRQPDWPEGECLHYMYLDASPLLALIEELAAEHDLTVTNYLTIRDGITARTFYRWRREGRIRVTAADAVCTWLFRHPSQVFPDWDHPTMERPPAKKRKERIAA